MKVILDSSILIDHLRGGLVGKKTLKELSEDTEIYLPTIVLFELFSGKSTQNPEVFSQITHLIKGFERIELTESIAVRAGELFRKTSQRLGPADYIIAASALEINGTVVTLNKKHFELIPNLKIYSIAS